jgi:crossover junction endodeoxyribonuclease RuvC
MGWAVIESAGNSYRHVYSGVIDSRGIAGIPDRLWFIYQQVTGIIDSHKPEAAALETVFFSKNQKSSFVLIQSATAAMLAAMNRGLRISEYQPMVIKKAVAGYGRAGKDQVQSMVKKLLNINEALLLDRSDAMAVAICHINSAQFQNRLLNHAASY